MGSKAPPTHLTVQKSHVPDLAWCPSDGGKFWVSLEAEQFEGDGGREEGTKEKQVGSHYYGGDGMTVLQAKEHFVHEIKCTLWGKPLSSQPPSP